MPLRTRRIYDRPTEDDGFRLLTMRLWPRGIAKTAVSAWEKELGPSRELLDEYKRERIDWPEFERRYTAEMLSKPDLLNTWAERARSETITLLCSCVGEDVCHRRLLKQMLESRG